MTRITLPITVVVQGSVLTRSSSIAGLGVDALMAVGKFKDNCTGVVGKRYYLPGRLVKGLLREAWQELSLVETSYSGLIPIWLGDESLHDSEDEPLRGRLIFSDFADSSTPVGQDNLRYRIGIDEERGAVDAGKLQVIESPYAPFQTVEFHGEVRALACTGEDTAHMAEALHRGLLWIRAVGATRTSGFGKVLDVKVLDANVGSQPPRPPVQNSLAGSRWNLRLSFDHPVILSKRRIADNLFESGDVLPGAALKGAIAGMIKREPAFAQLMAELSKVRFTHGFPAKTGDPRPCQWPLSLLSFFRKSIGKNEIVDVIRLKEPLLIEDCAGAFEIDWKDSAKHEDSDRVRVRTAFGWPKKMNRELRVRTAFDSTIRKSRDEALFAWQMLDPHGMEWVAQADTSTLSAAAREQLETVLRFGVEPLGKTKALAAIALSDAESPAVEPAKAWVVTLQTPALLINPNRHLAPDGRIGSAGEDDLRSEFRAAWSELSDGTLKLVNYFQRCSLGGGEYFRRRFAGGRAVYKPYLLSDPGCTFLLEPVEGKETQALHRLREWLARGLPLAPSVLDFYGIANNLATMWQQCPYIPENGYGEIAVNRKTPFREV